MKGTAWRIYPGIGALATGAYYLLPYDPAEALLNVVVGASAVAASRRRHPLAPAAPAAALGADRHPPGHVPPLPGGRAPRRLTGA